MSITMSKRRVFLVLCVSIGVAALCFGRFLFATSDDKKDAASNQSAFGTAFIKPLIATGSPSDTIAYYSQIGKYLGLKLITTDSSGAPNLNPQFTLDQLIAFAGFGDGNGGGLLAADTDKTPGPTLNDPVALAGAVSNPARFKAFYNANNLVAGELLAASFFAPKICNVGKITGSATGADPDQYGWRKVVRFIPRSGSDAKAKNVTGVWLLFNYFVPKASVSGTSLSLSGSVNTQAMLQFATVQNTPSVTGGNASKDAAYWLDFAEKTNALTDNLNASFDSGQGDIGSAGGNQKYYVPTACAVCHGGSRAHAAINVLDTDHWFERVRTNSPAGTDFTTLSNNAANIGVLLDAGPDLTKPQFHTGFEVFRKLNTEVLAQNNMSGAIIQPSSTKHWVDKHASSDAPLSLADRSLGTSPWTAADTNVLSYLDRYCYRCHNAIAYNVFDKNAVLFERSDMILRLQLDWSDPSNFQKVMPQDRHLDDQTVTQPLITLLNAVTSR